MSLLAKIYIIGWKYSLNHLGENLALIALM
jgi:hypothetical protein